MGLGTHSWNGERIKSGRDSPTILPIFKVRIDSLSNRRILDSSSEEESILISFSIPPWDSPSLQSLCFDDFQRGILIGVRQVVNCTKSKSTIDD